MCSPHTSQTRSDDEGNPDTTSYPPPSLPNIADAISASVHPPFDNPQCEITPVLEFPTDPVIDDAATRAPYPDAFPLEKAVTSAGPPPPDPRRSCIWCPPRRLVDYDTKL